MADEETSHRSVSWHENLVSDVFRGEQEEEPVVAEVMPPIGQGEFRHEVYQR